MNDYFDQRQDKIARKANLTVNKNKFKVLFTIFILWLSSSLLLLVFSRSAAILLLVQFALLFAYSSPLIRLKEHSFWGVITDAFVIPILIALSLFNLNVHSTTVISLLFFNLSIGIRDILIHQQKDIKNDLKSITNTFATKYKEKISLFLQTAQIAAIIALLVLIAYSVNTKTQLPFFILGLGCGFVLLFISIVYLKKSLKNNYLIRFFVLFSIVFLNYYFIEKENYFGLILCLHPYFWNFLTETKNAISLTVNSILYLIFKPFGRDIKKHPLYRKKNNL
jgi:hypothetical protein